LATASITLMSNQTTIYRNHSRDAITGLIQ